MSHATWANLWSCGLCVLWNGTINGGNPAFVDLLGAPLHPLVIATTLGWGTIVGAKVTLVASLALAGVGQWWLARVLRLGRTARMWSALMVVTCGHLVGRMEHGIVTLVLSTAACSLVLPPLLDVLVTGRRRSTVLLGITLALAVVSGQGYLQLGLLLGLGPAVLVTLLWPGAVFRARWRELALALGLAALLAGVFWVPVGHFLPQFSKEIEPEFRGFQPLGYLLLNLVIVDPDYFRSEVLGKQPYPFVFVNYVGWIPLLLALLGLRLAPRHDWPVLGFFVVAIGAVFVTASGAPLRVLALIAPDTAASVRNPALIAGLAVPLILGLAAYGVERVLRGPWPIVVRDHMQLRGRWAGLLLCLPLAWSVASAYTFGRHWLQSATREPMMDPVFDQLRTAGNSWVQTPYGEHYWNPAALEAGLKLTYVVRPWRWTEHPDPPAARRATYLVTEGSVARIGEIFIVDEPAHVYAAVRSGDRTIPCSASSRGGNIDIVCATDEPGVLEVQEHSWTGWYATRDGVALALHSGPWLSVAAPAGVHRYAFRYRPWDVAVGATLSSIGLLLAVRLWLGRPREIVDTQSVSHIA